MIIWKTIFSFDFQSLILIIKMNCFRKLIHSSSCSTWRFSLSFFSFLSFFFFFFLSAFWYSSFIPNSSVSFTNSFSSDISNFPSPSRSFSRAICLYRAYIFAFFASISLFIFSACLSIPFGFKGYFLFSRLFWKFFN